jgi:hypothetical protein
MYDADSIIREYAWLYSQQANFRMLWNSIAQYVMPAWDNFIGEFSEGVIRTTRLFDATAVSANERFAAAMEQMLTPRTQMWHDIVPASEELKEDEEVQAYCAQVRKILFAARYRPNANYASQTDECYMSLGAFGNNALLVDELLGKHLIYRSIPLNEIVWALDPAGMVDTVYRKFRYSAKQCVQKWGEKKLTEKIRRAYQLSPFTEFEILHCVRPNQERTRGAIGYKGMSYESWYIVPDERHTIDRNGYRTFPYAIGRYRMAPREHYGRSPAAVAYPAIRTLNEQKKTALRAGQKAVDPPLLLSEEGALTGFNLRGGALNYGALSSDGTPLVQPLKIADAGSFQIGKELMDMEASAINDAFLTSLFQILVQNPDMTATEALIRAQEKGMLIAPAMGRQQSEFLGPEIVREIDILHHARVLPPPPDQLIQAAEEDRGGLTGLKIEYTGPLSKLMRAEEAQTIMTSVQGISQVASVRPQILDLIDWDETGREFLEASGFPGKLILDPDRLAAVREQNAQQQQAQQVAAAAPGVSQAALNLAKAHQALNPGGATNAEPAAA